MTPLFPSSMLAGTLLGSLAVAAPAGCLLALLPPAMLRAACTALVAILIPAGVVAVWPEWVPPALAWHLPGLAARHGWPPLHLVLGALPVLLLPLARTMARLPAGQRRAGSGLGAGPVAMLRLVWLPQFGPPILLGAGLAVLLNLAALLSSPGRFP